MRYILFEDSHYIHLLPLVYFRPVWELRCGALTLEQKFKTLLGNSFHYIARDYLQKYYLPAECHWQQIPVDEEIILLNGRWLLTRNDVGILKNIGQKEALIWKETPLAFRASISELAELMEANVIQPERVLDRYTPRELSTRIVSYIWDILDWNGEEIVKDLAAVARPGHISGKIHDGVHMLNSKAITIAGGANIKPGVILDAEKGPIWIDEGALVMANSVLEGPIYVGKNSIIKIGAKLYGDTTIGPVCKVGGEVESSIFQGYSNKQHDGFLGHSYLGEWINLGADTNNSDLKNNYAFVRVMLNGRPVDTGKRFLGLIMGDHSKCAINTMFNTGTIVGVSCNIFGAGMPPKFVPSFSWGGANKLMSYNFEKAVEVAKIVMARRNIAFTERHSRLFLEVKKLAEKVEKR